MVKKLHEIDKDNVGELSREDLEKIALGGKDELLSARSLIGNLKGNKSNDDGENQKQDGLNEDEINSILEKRDKEKSLNDFISNNPQFSDYKEKLDSLTSTGLLSLQEAGDILSSKDETLANNTKTSQAGISGGTSGGNNTGWNGLVSYSDYKDYSPQEKELYIKNCEENNYGGLMLKPDVEEE